MSKLFSISERELKKDIFGKELVEAGQTQVPQNQIQTGYRQKHQPTVVVTGKMTLEKAEQIQQINIDGRPIQLEKVSVLQNLWSVLAK